MQHNAIYYNWSQIFHMLQFQYVVCNRSHGNPEPHGEDGNCKVQCSCDSCLHLDPYKQSEATEPPWRSALRRWVEATMGSPCQRWAMLGIVWYSSSLRVLSTCFSKFSCVHLCTSYIFKLCNVRIFMSVNFYCFSFTRTSVPSTCCQRYRLRGQCRVHLTVATMSSNLSDWAVGAQKRK